MLAVFLTARKFCTYLIGLLAAIVLSGCDDILIDAGPGQSIDPNQPVQVALLVPRGGGSSDDLLARGLENAARLAVADLRGASIDLRVYPTGGNAQTAAVQAQQAVADGAKVILGPLRAEAANAASVAVAGQNINVLSFSNNTTIAGGNLFVLGSTFTNTARRLAGYAASQGRNRVVVVHGNDVAGQLGRNAIQQAAASSGLQVTSTVGYDLSQQGVTAAVPQIKAAVDQGQANTLFMTSTSSGALPLFAGLLPQAGLNPQTIQYIGLARWDIPPQTLSLPGVQGSLFARPDPGRTSAFASRYQASYGSAPHPIAYLAFDGVAAIGALVANGRNRTLSRAALTQSAGFQGANGAFRLRNDGTNDRALAIATIRNGQVSIVDPAPSSFGGF